MDYQKQGTDFLKAHGFGLKFKRGNKSAKWSPSGHHYIVTLTGGGKDFVFDFWGSAADAAEGKNPTAYDILACLSSESTIPETADEVYEEFGKETKPSQAIAAVEFGKRIRAFFSVAELEALREIS